MSARRAYLLLEAVLGLALLAGLGVALLKLQAAALRQYAQARQQAAVAAQVEDLLWTWSCAHEPVTLPATGWFDARLAWRREVRPVRVAAGVLPTQISVVVTQHDPVGPTRDVYRVDWFVRKAVPRGHRP